MLLNSELSFQEIQKGSGLYGSITSKDLEGVEPRSPAVGVTKPAAAPGAAFVDIPVTNIRAVIAKRLLESKQVWCLYFS